jgi:hypothetical protein
MMPMEKKGKVISLGNTLPYSIPEEDKEDE